MPKWTRIVSLSIVLAAIFGVAQSLNVYSQATRTCKYGANSKGICYVCLWQGGGTELGTIQLTVGGGTGCGSNCQPDPELAGTEGESHPLTRGDDWVINVQDLFPDFGLTPGTIVTVSLVRNISADTETLLQPLAAGEDTALYMLEIGEDGSTEFSFGSISDKMVGGNYRAYGLPREIGSEQEFWESITPELAGVQTYNINNLVTVDAGLAQLDEYQRQIDVPITLDTDTMPGDIEIRLKNYPEATNPFQLGVYSSASAFGDQGRVEVFSPGEYLIDLVVEPIIPAYVEQFRNANPYFQANEYEYEVYVDGVWESSGMMEFP